MMQWLKLQYWALQLSSDSDLHRWHALVKLGEMKDIRACRPLAKALVRCVRDSCRSNDECAFTARVLRCLRCSCPAAIVETLTDPNAKWQTQEAAIEAIIVVNDRRALASMINIAEKCEEKFHIWHQLAKKSAELDSGTLHAMLTSGKETMAVPAGIELAERGDTSAVNPLISLMGSLNIAERAAVAKALGKLEMVPWSRWVRGDERDMVRLGQSKEPRAGTVLVAAVRHGDESAAKGLAHLKDPRTVEPLIETLSSSYFKACQVAGEALALLAQEEWDKNISGAWVPALCSVLRAKDFDARFGAARALAYLGDLRAIGPLCEGLRSELKGLRQIAADALSAVVKREPAVDVREDAVAELIDGLIVMHPDARLACASALASLGEITWQRWIRGDVEDFDRLCDCRDKRVVVSLCKALKHYFILGRKCVVQKICASVVLLCTDGTVKQMMSAQNAAGAVEPILTALKEYLGDGEMRRLLACALAGLDKDCWRQWVQGTERDYERLCMCGDSRAVEVVKSGLHSRDVQLVRRVAFALLLVEESVEVVRGVCSGLHSERYADRRDYVQLLVDLALYAPSFVMPNLVEIEGWFRVPYEVSHQDERQHWWPEAPEHTDVRHEIGVIGRDFPSTIVDLEEALASEAYQNEKAQGKTVMLCPNERCGKRISVPAGCTGLTGECPYCKEAIYIGAYRCCIAEESVKDF